MNSFDVAHLIYLTLLVAAIAASFFVANRKRLGQVAQQAAIWGLIFVGVIAAYGLWSDIRDDVLPGQAVFEDGQRFEVPRARDGHYYLTLIINDNPVRFVVDTGASDIVLSQQDATRIGLDPASLAYTGRASTANGEVRTASVVLDEIALGPLTDQRVRASVNDGEMAGSLLGMRYLQRFDSIEITGGKLILTRAR